MEQGVKRTQLGYLLSFKLAEVDQIEKDELTYRQAQKRYGIQRRPTVLVRLHGRLVPGRLNPIREGLYDAPKTPNPEQRIKSLSSSSS